MKTMVNETAEDSSVIALSTTSNGLLTKQQQGKRGSNLYGKIHSESLDETMKWLVKYCQKCLICLAKAQYLILCQKLKAAI